MKFAAETMMLREVPVLLLLLALLSPASGYAGQSGPSNFDECIIETMRGVSSDVAARAIIESCRNLFPEPQSKAPPPVAPAPPRVPAAAEDDAAPAEATAASSAAKTEVPVAAAPVDVTASRSLTADELALLRAAAKVFGSTYRVTIANGNPGVTLTEVTIAVWDDGDAAASRREYTEAVQIAPETSAMVKYTVQYRGDETGWNWGVVAARGVE